MGTVYEISAAGQETVLYSGQPSTGGGLYAGVIRDEAGNLYGTATSADGFVFRLSPSGKCTVLYTFKNTLGPTKPEGGLVRDPQGNLYGTTQNGGTANLGVVYKLGTTGTLTVLYAFPGAATNLLPFGPSPTLIQDQEGNLYGTTAYGGTGGMAYKIEPSGEAATLYSFSPAEGGSYPGAVVVGPDGDLYGTTYAGGAANAGVVYKLDSAGSETVLYAFTGGADGLNPDPQLPWPLTARAMSSG